MKPSSRHLLLVFAATAAFGLCQQAEAEIITYVSPDGANIYPYTSWENAATDINTAILGDFFNGPGPRRVIVTNGVYKTGSGSYRYKAATVSATSRNEKWRIESVNGPEQTIIEGGRFVEVFYNEYYRGVYLGSNATITGFTIRNGFTNPLGTGESRHGAGIFCEPGAVVSNCIITGNSSVGRGGGAYGGALYNCVIANNRASGDGDGAGASGSMLVNCVVYSNSADFTSGGGVSECTVANSVIYSNIAAVTAANINSSTVSFSCSPDLIHGVDGNITNEPAFADAGSGDFSLLRSSPCIDAGTNLPDVISDLAGCPRPYDGNRDGIAESDIGAYEFSALSPSGGEQLRTKRPVFSWLDTDDDWYYLWMSHNGTNCLTKWIEATNAWTSDFDFAVGEYRWWIRGWSNGDYVGPWQGPAEFIRPPFIPGKVIPVQIPAPSAPDTVEYSWHAAEYATRYQLWITEDGVQWHVKWYNTGLTTGIVKQVVSDHSIGATYLWWVRAWSPDGIGPWSDATVFTPMGFPGTPAVLFPRNDAPTGTLRYAWTASSNTTWYQVEISRDGAVWQTNFYYTGFITGRVEQIVPGHAANASYTWRIRGWHPDNYGAWSDNVAFSTVAPYPVDTFFVSTNGTDVWPHTNWATAARVIQDAVDIAHAGSTVIVSNGFYDVGARVAGPYGFTNRVVISNSITLRSANGPAFTSISGGDPGTNWVRCLYLDGGRLSGFTIRDGDPNASVWRNTNGLGGGVYASLDAVVSNCHFYRCSAGIGGAIYGGTIYDSSISNCGAYWRGGGAYGSTIYDSSLIDCGTDQKGAGAAYSTLSNCVIEDGWALHDGGGLYYCDAYSCVIVSNIADEGAGGAAVESRLFNCAISGNKSLCEGPALLRCELDTCTVIDNYGYRGSGLHDGKAVNTLFAENTCVWGGVASSSALIHCTVVSNYTTSEGTSVRRCTVSNSIIFGNTYWPSQFWDNTFAYSALGTNRSGIGVITNLPSLVDPANGNYRLKFGSRGIDEAVTIVGIDKDLDGGVRPLDGDLNSSAIPDMGCYEYDYNTSDSDTDTLPDAVEDTTPGYSPLNDDDDSDGIPTRLEAAWDGIPGEVGSGDLDPTRADSDNDGVNDIDEVAAGSDPLSFDDRNEILLSRVALDNNSRRCLEWPIYSNLRGIDFSFIVERSTNLSGWTAIGGHFSGGDADSTAKFVENAEVPGAAFYRLKYELLETPTRLPSRYAMASETLCIVTNGADFYIGTLNHIPVITGTVVFTVASIELTDRSDGTVRGAVSMDGTISYETGAWSFDVGSITVPDGTVVTADYMHLSPDISGYSIARSQVLAISTNGASTYIGILTGRSIIPGSVTVRSGDYYFRDDGSGSLAASRAYGSVSYKHGIWRVHSQDSWPKWGDEIVATYAYQTITNPHAIEAEILGTAGQQAGVLANYPVEPGTVAILVSDQYFIDDGNGVLEYPSNTWGNNHSGTIDYATGSWTIDEWPWGMDTNAPILAYYMFRLGED